MTVLVSELLEELTQRTKRHREKVVQWKKLPLEELKKRPSTDAWNALECLEHLNLYGEYYLPEIEKQMNSAGNNQAVNFNSGRLGNYFAKSMLPKEKSIKVKTFKDKNPLHKELDKEVLDEFIEQQDSLLSLLTIAENKNLNKIKTGISITKWIKLKLGDTFRIVIYHNERHVQQAQMAIDLSVVSV